jgi:hypothetical protein
MMILHDNIPALTAADVLWTNPTNAHNKAVEQKISIAYARPSAAKSRRKGDVAAIKVPTITKGSRKPSLCSVYRKRMTVPRAHRILGSRIAQGAPISAKLILARMKYRGG